MAWQELSLQVASEFRDVGFLDGELTSTSDWDDYTEAYMRWSVVRRRAKGAERQARWYVRNRSKKLSYQKAYNSRPERRKAECLRQKLRRSRMSEDELRKHQEWYRNYRRQRRALGLEKNYKR